MEQETKPNEPGKNHVDNIVEGLEKIIAANDDPHKAAIKIAAIIKDAAGSVAMSYDHFITVLSNKLIKK